MRCPTHCAHRPPRGKAPLVLLFANPGGGVVLVLVGASQSPLDSDAVPQGPECPCVSHSSRTYPRLLGVGLPPGQLPVEMAMGARLQEEQRAWLVARVCREMASQLCAKHIFFFYPKQSKRWVLFIKELPVRCGPGGDPGTDGSAGDRKGPPSTLRASAGFSGSAQSWLCVIPLSTQAMPVCVVLSPAPPNPLLMCPTEDLPAGTRGAVEGGPGVASSRSSPGVLP